MYKIYIYSCTEVCVYSSTGMSSSSGTLSEISKPQILACITCDSISCITTGPNLSGPATALSLNDHSLSGLPAHSVLVTQLSMILFHELFIQVTTSYRLGCRKVSFEGYGIGKAKNKLSKK